MLSAHRHIQRSQHWDLGSDVRAAYFRALKFLGKLVGRVASPALNAPWSAKSCAQEKELKMPECWKEEGQPAQPSVHPGPPASAVTDTGTLQSLSPVLKPTFVPTYPSLVCTGQILWAHIHVNACALTNKQKCTHTCLCSELVEVLVTILKLVNRVSASAHHDFLEPVCQCDEGKIKGMCGLKLCASLCESCSCAPSLKPLNGPPMVRLVCPLNRHPSACQDLVNMWGDMKPWCAFVHTSSLV
eukprot:1159435-Pelagomonas_calceolata.AAC.9